MILNKSLISETMLITLKQTTTTLSPDDEERVHFQSLFETFRNMRGGVHMNANKQGSEEAGKVQFMMKHVNVTLYTLTNTDKKEATSLKWMNRFHLSLSMCVYYYYMAAKVAVFCLR